jgi:hypothetical protein
MSKAEKVFVKMVDRTAKKLDLNEQQKIQLEQLKLDIRKNFQEARTEKKEVLMRIKDEAKKENPEIREMTSLLHRTFDLMLDFQTNLREPQEEKLVQMISDWVGKWD